MEYIDSPINKDVLYRYGEEIRNPVVDLDPNLKKLSEGQCLVVTVRLGTATESVHVFEGKDEGDPMAQKAFTAFCVQMGTFFFKFPRKHLRMLSPF